VDALVSQPLSACQLALGPNMGMGCRQARCCELHQLSLVLSTAASRGGSNVNCWQTLTDA
jgi:hypothetical protein